MPLTRQIGQSASEDRLEKLIEDRLKPGADKSAIDRRIWDLFGEEWAVMFTDLSGFSRGVEAYGEMLRIGDHDVFGAEVNAASKLGEDMAKAKQILVTENVKITLEKKI